MSADFLALLDVAGVYVFALSGAVVAVRHNMDIVGVAVLALVTGFGGGVVRDVMIGELPPQIVRSQGLLLVPVAASLTAVVIPHVLDRLKHPVLALDAVGLGLFATVGATKAVDAGIAVVPSVLIGTVAAVGGGLVRDVLADEIPQILAEGSRLYAIPAALGAATVAVGAQTPAPMSALQVAAAAITVSLRLLALRYGWHAPMPRRATP